MLIVLALSGGNWWEGWLFPALIAACAAGSLWRLFWRSGQPCQLIMNRFGVQFLHPSAGSEVISWRGFQTAGFRWLSGTMCLVADNGTLRYRCRVRELGGTTAARDLGDRINRARADYLSSQLIADSISI